MIGLRFLWAKPNTGLIFQICPLFWPATSSFSVPVWPGKSHSRDHKCLFQCTLQHCLRNTSDDNLQCNGSDPISDIDQLGSTMDHFHFPVSSPPFSWRPVTYFLIFPWLDGSLLHEAPRLAGWSRNLGSPAISGLTSTGLGTQRMEDLHFSRK